MNLRSLLRARPRRSGRACGPIAGAVLLVALAPSTLPAAPVAAAGIPQVIGGATPRDGVQTLELEEIWRRGGLDDEEVLLGIVTAVETGPDGNLYVLDAQLMEVKVFDAAGQVVGTLGRQGEGPGEFTNANTMTFLPDGTLGIVQGMPGKIVRLNLDGTPGEVIPLSGDPAQGGFTVVQNAAAAGGTLVAAGIEFRMAPDGDQFTRLVTSFLRSYDLGGDVQHEFFAREDEHVFGEKYELDELRWDSPTRRYAVDPAGQVIVAEQREQYRFSVYGPDGELRRVFGREFTSLPRSEAMLARYDRMLEMQARQMSPTAARKLAENEPDVWDIHCHGDGSYWVLNSRGLFEPPAGTFTSWDVFAADGEFVKQVTASIPGTPGEDLLFLTDQGLAVQVTGFWEAVLAAMGAGSDDPDAEPMEIVCYRIQ